MRITLDLPEDFPDYLLRRALVRARISLADPRVPSDIFNIGRFTLTARRD